MRRFIEGCDRSQSTMFPAILDDYVGEDIPVRAIDVFVEGVDPGVLGYRPLYSCRRPGAGQIVGTDCASIFVW